MNLNITPAWRERLKSPLTWHYAGFGVLLLITVGLGIRFGLDWAATSGSSTDALAIKQVQLKAMDLQTAPLRGLDNKVPAARAQILQFLGKRIPPNYSSISTRVGELQVASGVRLSRLGYTQAKPGEYLTKISLDSGISGDYPQIMRFVNSLERDQTFFVITGMSLTGQQGGLVNLRLEVATWLRPEDAAASGLPLTPEPGSSGTAQPDNAQPAAPQSGPESAPASSPNRAPVRTPASSAPARPAKGGE
jgi:type IV pilus assembly protein PilO